MNTISDKTFDILVFKHNLYLQRINDEIDYIKKQEKSEENESRIKYLEEVLNNYNNEEKEKVGCDVNKILTEKTSSNLNNEFKKTWGRMNIAFKKVKLNEYCDENKIELDIRMKYLRLLDEKQLKTKNVKYDNEKMKIIEIKI